ncbi:hypothetical protein QZH41_013846, partial [Actinostola sp. cb2023]
VNMAMRDLVEGECGGANPLMKLVSHFTQDQSLHQEGLVHDRFGPQAHLHQRAFHETHEHELADEYLRDPRTHAPPQTFRMDALLHEMKEIEDRNLHHTPVRAPGIADMVSSQWASDFMSSEVQRSEEWTKEYEDVLRHHPRAELHQTPVKWAREYLDNVRLMKGNVCRIKCFSIELFRVEEYKVEDDNVQLAAVAGNLLENNQDPKFANSKVIDAKTGQEVTDDSLEVDDWITDYDKFRSGPQDWASEFMNMQGAETSDVDYWNHLQDEWEDLVRQGDEETQSWYNEYEATINKEYKFEDDNPLLDHPNPFEEGLKKLKEGDLISAILLFESETIFRFPYTLFQAWQYLGTSQAENEQDTVAITALNKCLELQSNNLTALMALAVSYTNESMQSQACNTLKRWLGANTRYSDLVPHEPRGATSQRPVISSIMSPEMYNEIKGLYIAAAQKTPENDIDPTVQVGLGVLFNLSGEYDKAVDCFQSGLQVCPDDSLLWNRLGATLANGGRSEEAVDAYRHALSYSPGFIRCRYNLGISCINLGAHKEAVEHFLTALNMQRKGEQGAQGPHGNISTMSDNIWSTLRMTLSLMGKPELYQCVDQRDLDHLNSIFPHESEPVPVVV